MERQTLEVEGYEEVVRFRDEGAGLDAVIAIHSTALGPGFGGCRMYPYPAFEDGLEDVKRLSKGMTYKNALAGIPFGGGKSVMFADPRKDKTAKLFAAFAEAVNALGGRYYTAQDSGVSKADFDMIAAGSKWAGGVGLEGGGGGDPSPYTSYGVWRAVQATALKCLGASDLKGVRVIVMGLGAVGMGLAKLLHEEGAEIVASDIDPAKIEAAKVSFGATGAHHIEAHAFEADIYAPCALGGALNDTVVQKLRVKGVAGGANNQLATPQIGDVLRDKGILYAPDYVVNAGGVISIGHELAGAWTREKVYARLDAIADTLNTVFERAEAEGLSTHSIADRMAEEVIAKGR